MIEVIQPSLDGTQATRPITITTYDADGNVHDRHRPAGLRDHVFV